MEGKGFNAKIVEKCKISIRHSASLDSETNFWHGYSILNTACRRKMQKSSTYNPVSIAITNIYKNMYLMTFSETSFFLM